MKERILVTGATGNVGGALARLLVDAGRQVVVGVRNVKKARDRFEDRAQVRVLDFTRPQTCPDAVAGIDRAFLLNPPGEADPEHVAATIDALKQAGANHVVLMTALGVDQEPESAPLRRLERHAQTSGLDATILRPNGFMQNFATGALADSIRAHGVMQVPAGEGRCAFIDARDVAAVAAVVLTSEAYRKRAIPLTGTEALGHAQVAALLTQALGRPIRYDAIPDDEARADMLRMGVAPGTVEYLLGLYGRVRAGEAAMITSAVLEITGRPPRTLHAFVHDFAEIWQ